MAFRIKGKYGYFGLSKVNGILYYAVPSQLSIAEFSTQEEAEDAIDKSLEYSKEHKLEWSGFEIEEFCDHPRLESGFFCNYCPDCHWSDL